MSLFSAFMINVIAALFNYFLYRETKFGFSLMLAVIAASFALVLLLVMVSL